MKVSYFVGHALFVCPSPRHELQIGDLHFAPARMTRLEGELGANSMHLHLTLAVMALGR